MFKYQDHVIEYVEVFERIDKCTEEIMVNFKLEGVPIIGFLSNQNVILGNSLEIDCQDSLNTIIDHDDYKILTKKNFVHVSFKSKLKKSNECIFISSSTVTTTTTITSISSAIISKPDPIGTFFYNFFNDVNDYIYIFFNCCWIALVAYLKRSSFCIKFNTKSIEPYEINETHLKDIETKIELDELNSQLQTAIVSSIAKQISEIPIKNNICIAHPLLSINKLEEDDF